MIIVPTRGRPALMQRFFDEGRPRGAGCVVIDEDQADMYSNLWLPHNWKRMIVAPMQGFVKKCNLAFARIELAQGYANDYYAFAGDDCVGRTPGWDVELGDIAADGNIAWGNDLIAGRCTHPFICADFARNLGWLCHPGFKHLYVDTVWEEVANTLGIGVYRPDIITEAHHFCNGKLPMDQTARERMEENDAAAWSRIDLTSVARTVHLVHEGLSR